MSNSFHGATDFEINNSTFYQVNLGNSVYICIGCDPTARSALEVGLRVPNTSGLWEPPSHHQPYPVHESGIGSAWPEVIQCHQRQIMPLNLSSESGPNPLTQVYPTPIPYTQYNPPFTYREVVGPLQFSPSLQLQLSHPEVPPVGLLSQDKQVENKFVRTVPTESSVAAPVLSGPLVHQYEERSIPFSQCSFHQGYNPHSAEAYFPPSVPFYHYPAVDPYAQRILDDVQLRQLSYSMLWGGNQPRLS